MTTKEAEQRLLDVLVDDYAREILTTRDLWTFEEVGLMTGDRGLVIRLEDGSEFQLTIVQSQPGRGT